MGRRKSSNKNKNHFTPVQQNREIAIVENNHNSIENEIDDDYEYDNNPFVGTTHMFASGIHDIPPTSQPIDTLLHSPTKPQYLYEDGATSPNPLGKDPLTTSSHSSLSTHLSANSTNSSSPNITQQYPDSYSPIQQQTNSGSTVEPFENLSMSMAVPKNKNLSINNNNNNNIRTSDNHKTSSLSPLQDDQIVIVDCGDYNDPWGKHAIGYIIKSKKINDEGVIIEQEVTRRYSEFHSLHHVLTRLLPTVIIPPIPSKHSIIKYFLNPINAENDSKIIAMRQRRLMAFLNHCNAIVEINQLITFQKFLDPNYLWKDILNSPPISILPTNNLLAPPLNPTKPSPLHLLLPSPTTINTNIGKFLSSLNLTTEELESFHLNDFHSFETQLTQFLNVLQPLLQRVKNNKFHIHSVSSQFAELGAYFNALSLENTSTSSPDDAFKNLPMAIEKIGHSYDVNYVTLEILIENLQNLIEEPLIDLIKFIQDSKRIIIFKNLKFVQYQIIINTIEKRKSRLNELNDFDNKMHRLDVALNRDAITSPTVANAVRNMNKQDNTNNTSKSIDQDDNMTTDEITSGNITNDNISVDDESSQIMNDSQYLIQLQLQKNKQKLSKRKNKTTNKFGQIEPEFLTKIERDEEIKKLNKELLKLKDCEVLIKSDLVQVIESTLTHLNDLIKFVKRSCHFMLKDMTRAIIDWIKECLTTWQQTKSKIDSI